MKTEGEIRSYRDALKRYMGCCSVPAKNAEISSNLKTIAWILEEEDEGENT
jgi:hypothetical protein